jgi:branched-chain amino acid transport system permease protein
MKSNLTGALILLSAAFVAQVLAYYLPPYFTELFIFALINAILAVSLNLVNGLSGQFSLGHAGFMAVGAYTSASVDVFFLKLMPGKEASCLGKAALHLHNLHSAQTGNDFYASSIYFLAKSFDYLQTSVIWSQFALLLSLLAAALASALAGYLVGLPSLRLRGDYLAIATLGFGEIIRVVILNIQAVGGARGLPDIPGSSTAFLSAFILAACVLATHRFVVSTHGRALLSIRENEIAAEAMGVNTTRYKVQAFVVSSAVAGVAGGLFAHYLSFISPSSFDFMKSVEIVIMVVLGGMGSVSGSILAAFIITFLPEALRPLQQWTGVDLRMVIYSLSLILMMLLRPKGMFGRKELWQMFPKKD